MDTSRLIDEGERASSENFNTYEKYEVAHGTNRVRLIGEWARYYEHWIRLAGEKPQPVYTNGKGSSDPLNEFIKSLMMSGDPVREKMASDIVGKVRYVMNVVPMSDDGTIDEWCTQNGHTMLLVQNKGGNNFGPMIFEGISECAKSREKFIGAGSGDPELYDIVITKSGKDFTTKYKVEAVPGVENKPLDRKYETYDPVEVTKLTEDDYLQKKVNALRDELSEKEQAKGTHEFMSDEEKQEVKQANEPAGIKLTKVEKAPEDPRLEVGRDTIDMDCPECDKKITVDAKSSDNIVCQSCGSEFESPF